MAEHFEKIFSMVNRVAEAFILTTSPVSLNATLDAGKAYIGGYEVGAAAESENLTFAASNTNHIFISQTGVVTVNTTGTPPANSLKLFEVITDGSGVTSDTDLQDNAVEFQAPLIAQSIESLAEIIGEFMILTKVQPYLEFEDTSGSIFRLWNRSGKLQVTDQAGTTVYTDDLSDVLAGGSFIDTSEKGAPNGVATLNGTGVHALAERAAATTSEKGAALVATATPAALADTTAAIGASTTRWAREDHVHAHGTRGGGTLHAAATGATAGFLPATDKAKLDAATAATTASTLVLRDGSGRAKFVDPSALQDAATKNYVDSSVTTAVENASSISDVFLLMGA